MLAITITILSAAAVSCATPSSRNCVASLSAGSLRRSAVPAGALMRLRGGQYSLGLRDSIMIAHSFKGEEFGPAQNMHGATYTVDVEFHVDELVRSTFACRGRAAREPTFSRLQPRPRIPRAQTRRVLFIPAASPDTHLISTVQAPRLNWVLDIGEGMTVLKEVLAQYNLKNLDELFPGENTTTEFMCRYCRRK